MPQVKYVQEGHCFRYDIGTLPVTYIHTLADVSVLTEHGHIPIDLEDSAALCRECTIIHLKRVLEQLEAEAAEDVPDAEL